MFDHVKQARKLLSKRQQIIDELAETYVDYEKMKKDLKVVLSDKIQTIWKIFDKGKEPKVVIYRWGLTEQEAFEVEATLIDMVDCMSNSLTNIQCGHDSEHGMTTPERLEQLLNRPVYTEPKDLNGCKIPYIIIKLKDNIGKRSKMQGKVQGCWHVNILIENNFEDELYKAVRGCWYANLERASQYQYVLAVVRGVVQEVYEVETWDTSINEKPRIEFDGKPTTNPVMRALVGKLIPVCYSQRGMSNPFLYC